MRFNFFFFFFVTLLVMWISQTVLVSQTEGVFASIFSPIQRVFFGIFIHSAETAQIKKIEEENRTLTKQVVDRNSLVSDIQALKDQFQVAYPKSQNLLFAHIVGAPHFIPGVTNPEYFILDKGKREKVNIGQAVVYKDTLVGKVVEVSEHLSKIDLITTSSSSFTAKVSSIGGQVSKKGTLGIIKGKGNGEMILDNVLLSEELSIGDIIVTRGDETILAVGIPPDLMVGKISSVDKKPSSLFQTAKIKSILNFSKLSAVYIVIQNE